MAITDCSKCGSKLRIVPETVGNDSQGLPIVHRIGYCDNCMTKIDLDYSTQQNYEKQKSEKKHSKLSIWALILSLFGCTTFVAIILALVDLCQNDKNKKHTGSWFAIIVTILYALLVFGGFGGSNTNESKDNYSNISVQQSTSAENSQKDIKYISCNVDEMMEMLGSNALKAEKTYQDQYLEVTGKLSVIDSDGKYISLYPANDEWALTGIQCYIKNEDQLNEVLELEKDDIITIKVKCKSVGEVLGYSADIIEFVK